MQRVPTITFENTSQFKIVWIMRRRHLMLMCLARWLSTSLWRTALRAVRTSRTFPCSIRTLLMGCFLNGYSSLRTWVSFFCTWTLSLSFSLSLPQLSIQPTTDMTPVLLPGSLRIASLHHSLQTQTSIAQGLSSSSVCFFYQEISFDHQLTLTNPILFSFRWNFIQYFSKPGRRISPR